MNLIFNESIHHLFGFKLSIQENTDGPNFKNLTNLILMSNIFDRMEEKRRERFIASAINKSQ